MLPAPLWIPPLSVNSEVNVPSGWISIPTLAPPPGNSSRTPLALTDHTPSAYFPLAASLPSASNDWTTPLLQQIILPDKSAVVTGRAWAGNDDARRTEIEKTVTG